MVARLIKAILLVTIVIGGVFAWRSGSERSRLEARHAALVAATTEMAIDDPIKVVLRAIDTDDPLHFAWRIYMPAGSMLRVRTKNGGMSTTTSSSSAEYIARVRLRITENRIEEYTHFGGGSSRGSLNVDARLLSLLSRQAEKLKVDQLGRNETIMLDPAKSVVLLRIGIPPGMEAEAKALPSPGGPPLDPVLYELKFGPEAPADE